jgi:hypothetical protein
MKTVLLGAALLLVAAAAWLALDNPDIHDTSYGESYTCLAPWDTVLNGASDFPGGEPPTDADSIASRCRTAGRLRFGYAAGCGIGAVAVVVVAGAVRRQRAQAT